LATQLFERALGLDEYQNASELYRFLRSIDESEREEALDGATSPNAQTPNDANMFKFEQSIHLKAHKILLKQCYRELLKFSALFSISLPQFLKETRGDTKTLVKDWKGTLIALHEQFGWSWPAASAVAVLGPRRSSKTRFTEEAEAQMEQHRGRNKPIPTKGAAVRKREELRSDRFDFRHLLKACIVGEFPELALLLSTMLLLSSEAHQALSLIPEYSAQWAVCTSSNSVYSSFVNRLLA
jgi:hypothetical protein